MQEGRDGRLGGQLSGVSAHRWLFRKETREKRWEDLSKKHHWETCGPKTAWQDAQACGSVSVSASPWLSVLGGQAGSPHPRWRWREPPVTTRGGEVRPMSQQQWEGKGRSLLHYGRN